MPDFETAYRAMASRDQRFDGRFVVAVTSTRVYCRPSCPSRTPLRPNVRFFALPAAAEANGFRACRRCRPDATPASPEWNARGDLTARALRLIAGGAVDRDGVAGLARRLAVSERHLHRQLVAEVGVGPQRLAISRRAQVARLLVESGGLALAEVAFAAGYASVRQFNEGMRAAFGRAPGELRRARTGAAGGPLTLSLRYRPPLPVEPLLGYLAARALPGVETVEGRCYRRTMRLPHGAGHVAVQWERISAGDRWGTATVRLELTDLRDVAAAVQRCREIFDLDTDPDLITAALSADPLLAPLVWARPGLRVPGCADGFETAVLAVLGRRLSGRLITRFGTPHSTGHPALTHLFPTPEALADVDVEATGMSRRRAETVRALARAGLASAGLVLDRGADREQTVAALRAIPGIGPKTAGYIALRALGDPDVLPPDDPGLRETALALGITDLASHAQRWRPWRSYATQFLKGAPCGSTSTS